jgi:hypothetical protein
MWYGADGEIHGFQLSYDLERRPRALTWTRKRGFSHSVIDDGEESVLANRSPLLRASAEYDAPALRGVFAVSSRGLPTAEGAFIEGKLAESARCL